MSNSIPYTNNIVILITVVYQCFEGMKAYRGSDGRIRLFRPMENMNRLKRSAVSASLPVSSTYHLQLAGLPEQTFLLLMWLCLLLNCDRLINGRSSLGLSC